MSVPRWLSVSLLLLVLAAVLALLVYDQIETKRALMEAEERVTSSQMQTKYVEGQRDTYRLLWRECQPDWIED